MDQNSKQTQLITEDYRKKIYDDLADTMIAGLINGEILDEESKDSSKYILSNLDNIKTEQELMQFLEDLANKWSVYRTVLLKLKNEQVKSEDVKKLSEVQNKLHQLIT